MEKEKENFRIHFFVKYKAHVLPQLGAIFKLRRVFRSTPRRHFTSHFIFTACNQFSQAAINTVTPILRLAPVERRKFKRKSVSFKKSLQYELVGKAAPPCALNNYLLGSWGLGGKIIVANYPVQWRV